MNKKLLFGLFASLAIVGCQKENVSNGNVDGDGYTTSYLAVSIAQAPETRATYEDGSATENAVTSVRFYFFDSEGNAVNVKAGSTVNYYDWVPTGPSDPNIENVEKQYEAVLVVSTKNGDKRPAKILAVLNPAQAGVGSSSLTLSAIRALNQNFATAANNTSNPVFVMVSSVYAESGAKVSAAEITAANLCTSEDLAKASPVQIYVERNVAKVRTSIASTLKSGDYYIVNKSSTSTAPLKYFNGTDSTQVYLNVLGWDLTATTATEYLSKHINPTWGSTLFSSSEPWNNPTYHRSYWALNYRTTMDENGTDAAGIQYTSFNNHLNTSVEEGSNVLYTNENAASEWTGEARKYPTQLFVKAQLVKDDGTPIELGEFAGTQYVGEDALKAGMMGSVYLYTRTTTDDGQGGTSVSYTKITPDDLKLVVADVTEPAGTTDLTKQDVTGRYWVVLGFANSEDVWYLGTSAGAPESTTATALTATEAANVLTDQGHAKCWKSGYTYYYTPIKHIGTTIGSHGVVRNHIYDLTINSFAGYGTPVYDPNETIYPETPQDEDTYIAAQINILSWRLVKNSVVLGQ